ncbi:MAG: septum formation protein Maf [Phycisphaerae bacterium]|nr:Maf family protein [Phycisphaerae bacterium]NUQ47132.1 septum formation protein Maf [Phycisphaerae bacterium]
MSNATLQPETAPLRLQPEPLVLASGSPRRRELMQSAGYRFEVRAPLLNEPNEVAAHLPPAPHAEALAYFKACSVADAVPDSVVLGADTIVELDGRTIGQPRDRDDARRILSLISGNVHRVITGVALLKADHGRRLIQHDVTVLRMRPMSQEEMTAYLDGGEWQGKAGAYAIQESGDRFVEVLQGSLSNVVGLPMELLERMIQAWMHGR